MWRINGPKQIVKVILCCGRYRDGNRHGRHGNAAGSFGGFNSQTYADASTTAPSFEITRVEERRVHLFFATFTANEVEGRGYRRERGRPRGRGTREGREEREIRVGGKGGKPRRGPLEGWKEGWRRRGTEGNEKKVSELLHPTCVFL